MRIFLGVVRLLLTLACVWTWAGTWARAAPAQPPSVRVLLPAARDANAPGGLPLRQLVDVPMRDPFVTRGPDGFYYLTGTTSPDRAYTPIRRDEPDGQMWTINDGVRLWRSRDMLAWEPLGLVWSIDRDGADTWVHPWPKGEPNPGVPIWAPEIHFIKGTWWIPYSAKLAEGRLASGLLRSTSGKPEGPYREVQPGQPLGADNDPSLFQDDDGTVYYFFGGFSVARMTPDMTRLAEPARRMQYEGETGWGEGIFVTKTDGNYVVVNAGNATFNPTGANAELKDVSYDCFSAVSRTSIYGPYSPRRRTIPHDGHNNLFKDDKGQWFSTYFGSDPKAPLARGGSGRPHVMPVTIDKAGRLSVARPAPRPEWRYTTDAPAAGWEQPAFRDTAWQRGGGAFGDPKVADHGTVTDVGTTWTAGAVCLRKTFTPAGPRAKNPALYLRHNGAMRVFLNGKLVHEAAEALDDYALVPLPDASALRDGLNVLAVRCEARPDRPAYVDVGLVDAPRRAARRSSRRARIRRKPGARSLTGRCRRTGRRPRSTTARGGRRPRRSATGCRTRAPRGRRATSGSAARSRSTATPSCRACACSTTRTSRSTSTACSPRPSRGTAATTSSSTSPPRRGRR